MTSNLEQKLTEKLAKYESLTKKALSVIEVKQGLDEKEAENAEMFLKMAKAYYDDALYFKKKGDFLTALAAFSYAHAWLDAGVKARVFKTDDDRLFTLP